MFNDEDDLAAYEDELYREDSSSDESIDSEVETYLYSQVHYSQNLNEDSIDKLEDQKKDNVVENLKTKPQENNAVIVISDSDDIRASDSSAVIIISDTFEEESVYSSKIKSKVTSVVRKPENQSTPKVTLKGKKLSKLQETKSPNSGKNYKGGIVQQVMVIKGSSEDEVVSVEEMSPTSESDQSDVENWMLLGRAREDGDASITLNLMADRSASNEERLLGHGIASPTSVHSGAPPAPGNLCMCSSSSTAHKPALKHPACTNSAPATRQIELCLGQYSNSIRIVTHEDDVQECNINFPCV